MIGRRRARERRRKRRERRARGESSPAPGSVPAPTKEGRGAPVPGSFRSLFVSFGAAFLLIVVAIEYGPVLRGRIPFPAEIVVQFPVWDGVRPDLPPVHHPEQGDIVTQFYPFRVNVVEALHRGRMPLWNDAILFGCPMLANAQSTVFDPVHLLTTILPARYSWGAAVPIRPLLAGAGAALLVDALGGTLSGSWLAGIVFAFSGFLSSWRGRPQESTGIWLPLVLFAIDRLARRRDRGAVLFAAAAGSLPLLGGHPEVAFQMALVAAAFAAFRLISPAEGGESPGRRTRFARGLLLAGVGAAALCLVQLGPTLEWVMHLSRSLKRTWGHLPTGAIATFFSRNKVADPNSDGYAAMISLLLIPFAFRHRNRRDAMFFAFLLFASIEISFGLPPFYELSQALPILSGLPNARFLLAADLSLAVLAGLGLSAIEQARDRARLLSPAVLSSVALAAGAAWLVFPRVPPPLDLDHVWLVRKWSSVGWVALAMVAVVLAAIGKMPRWLRARAAVAIAAADLLTFQHGRLPFVDADAVFPPAPVLDFLRSRTGDGARIATTNVTMGSNFEMMYGLKTPGGYDFRLKRTNRILTPFGLPRGQIALSAAAIAASPPRGIFDLLGVRYLLATTDNSSSADLERDPVRFPLVYRDHSIRVYENVHALPRAFFLPETAVDRYATENLEAKAVTGRGFDATRRLVLSGSAGPSPAGSSPEGGKMIPAGSFQESPGIATFQLDAPAAGFAVVSVSSYPGWRAWVNDRPTGIVRADYAFQGIPVGPGRHRVVLRYEPPIFRASFMISLAGWLGLIACAVRSRFQRPFDDRPSLTTGRGPSPSPPVFAPPDSPRTS